jgi:hypothetical protein
VLPAPEMVQVPNSLLVLATATPIVLPDAADSTVASALVLLLPKNAMVDVVTATLNPTIMLRRS